MVDHPSSPPFARLSVCALKVVGSDAEGEVRVLELPEHPFFVATLFVPQTRSRPQAPHPLVSAFLEAIKLRHDEPSLAHVGDSRTVAGISRGNRLYGEHIISWSAPYDRAITV